jgi:competence protein ComEA
MIDDPERSAPRRWTRGDPRSPDGLAEHPGVAGWTEPFLEAVSPPRSDGARVALLDGEDVWSEDEWTEGEWQGSPAGPVAVGANDGPRAGSRRPGRGTPLLLRAMRPWFEPRPGELRGAIVLLSVALAVSIALWFDATRRPVGQHLVVSPSSTVAAPGEVDATAGRGDQGMVVQPGRADGSDGWGLQGSREPQGPVVHVSGAVLRPGVVTVAERARVADAIDAVGGALSDARLDALNLARVVEDGERIHVPRDGEDAPVMDGPVSRGVLADGRIDLNAASQAELETLPGVGPARARAIIAEREVRAFRAPGDLRRVPGIGEATFQRLAPLVTVR